ncbi:complement regulator-acquiring protein (plasmid) [Borreliella spielmanii]|uniref:Putative antigen, P35 n=1 Tax=Borreliella spielmanii A14S TaxID=498742 RepID=C0RCD5_9SPIR|nr:complement regulator-acquiring protein [Borreliella spielmanii]ACN53449.1 putative antigen, P35 [Borreliella spielmanii A14S]
MKKNILNIIKLNIITAILTLICISCAPLDNVNPNKLKSHTNPRKLKKTKSRTNSTNLEKNNQNLKNESQNLKHLAENNQNLKNGPQNPKYSNQNSQEKILLSKLEKIDKDLKDQKKQEDIQIANIDAQDDFLETFKLQRDEVFMHITKMILKRIIYSSLNYEKEKILLLKEILEKLDNNEQDRRIARTFLETSRDIQLLIEKIHSISIQDISKKEAEELLEDGERSLKAKQNFAKTLSATIDAYSKDFNNLKTNLKNLATPHIKDKYYHLSLYLPNKSSELLFLNQRL